MSPQGRLCPSCGDLVYGACPRCGTPAPSARKLDLQAVYRDRRFKRARAQAAARDGHACVDCGATEKLLGDHVLPIDGPDDPLAFDVENIATRCFPCSGRKDGGRRYS